MIGVHAFIFGSLSGLELLVIGLASVLIFGGRLPEVAMRAIAHVMRARRSLSQMWRDTGLEEELRRVRRDIEMKVPRTIDVDLQKDIEQSDPARIAAARARKAAEVGSGPDALGAPGADEYVDPDYGDHEFDVDPDADRRESYSFEPIDDAIAQGDVMPEVEDEGAEGDEPRGDGDEHPDDDKNPRDGKSAT